MVSLAILLIQIGENWNISNFRCYLENQKKKNTSNKSLNMTGKPSMPLSNIIKTRFFD
jgi:hypothetical protein